MHLPGVARDTENLTFLLNWFLLSCINVAGHGFGCF